eukprot:3325356-Lingulodinium_polyedra.AAC.1
MRAKGKLTAYFSGAKSGTGKPIARKHSWMRTGRPWTSSYGTDPRVKDRNSVVDKVLENWAN